MGGDGGMTLPALLPFQRPPDFGLHGVHRLVHFAGGGLVKALMHHHGWTKGRALVWVQWFLDDIRVDSRTSYGYSNQMGYQTSDFRLLWTITPNPPPPPRHPF